MSDVRSHSQERNNTCKTCLTQPSKLKIKTCPATMWPIQFWPSFFAEHVCSITKPQNIPDAKIFDYIRSKHHGTRNVFLRHRPGCSLSTINSSTLLELWSMKRTPPCAVATCSQKHVFLLAQGPLYFCQVYCGIYRSIPIKAYIHVYVYIYISQLFR
jgi:hypothetical protein